MSRIPLIRFIGKRHPFKSSGSPNVNNEVKKIVAKASVTTKSQGSKALDFLALEGGAWFGRPRLSELESAVLSSGGCIDPEREKPKKK